MRDWQAWHLAYDDPGSSLSRRLTVVRRRVDEALDALGPGPRRLLSLCAGDGRDVLPALARHPRRDDVHATLVELDPHLAEAASDASAGLGLRSVTVHRGDAGIVGEHLDELPVDVLLLCGIFGNVATADVQRTIGALGHLVASAGTVIWTRGASTPDLRPGIRAWVVAAGFEEVAFDGAPEPYGVGVARRRGAVPIGRPLPHRLFTFVV